MMFDLLYIDALLAASTILLLVVIAVDWVIRAVGRVLRKVVLDA